MRKVICVVAAAFAALVAAGQGLSLDQQLETIRQGYPNRYQIQHLRVMGTAVVPSLVVTGALSAAEFPTISTTGDVAIAEGKLADSTVVSADIKDATIVNADISASAGIALTKLAAGNLAIAYLTNAVPALASGNFYVIDGTQLVFVAGSVTNPITSWVNPQ